MKRKSASILLLLIFLISLFPSNVLVASASVNIKIGDYIQMGTYYGEPILWRCVDIDENGPLILSDKLICIKPFDAPGYNSSGSHGRIVSSSTYRKDCGSNYWKDSNIRCWLNSSQDSGNVEYICGNAPTNNNLYNGINDYANECGFLNEKNFSLSEKSLMKDVEQKQIINGYEYSYPNRNNNYHKLNESIDNVLQNYDSAYSETAVDKVFLLDVKQVYNVYKNLGNYYLAKPTDTATKYSEYQGISPDNYLPYYLRTPDAESYWGDLIRIVYTDGSVGVGNANLSFAYGYMVFGIRPAFYMSDGASFPYGNGNRSNPYALTNISVSSVSMMSPAATIKVGDTYRAMAYCMPTNAADKALTWSTNNPLVATVNNNGVVTAKGPGKATITAKSSNGKIASCIVTVTSVENKYYGDYKYPFMNHADSFGYSNEKDAAGKVIKINYKIPKERYLQLGYTEQKAKNSVKTWGGNCFGMSMSSILFYKNILKEENYHINGLYEEKPSLPAYLLWPNKNKKLREMIELLHISQNLNSATAKPFKLNNVMNELSAGKPIILGMYEKGRKKGHAIVINDCSQKDSQYNLEFYDCGYYITSITCDSDSQITLTCTQDAPNWKIFEYYSYDDIYDTYLSILKHGKDSVTLFTSKEITSYTQIIVPANDMEISNLQEKKLNIQDGEIFNDIEDVKVIPSSYLADEQTYTIILPTDTYTIAGSGDEVITTSFADDYMSASVTAKSSTPITISSDLKEISVDTATDEEYDITYTTYDNIFDEMTLSGTATGTVISKLNDTDITITGVNTLTASASVSDVVVSTNSNSLSNSDEITVKCEETDSGATIQILSADAELTDKTSLPERLTVDTPAYDLVSGTYTEGQVLNFTKDDDTIIYYTTDGSIPSANNGIIYSLPIDINKSMTVKALSTKYGYLDSEIVELNYTLPEVDMPQANVEPGEYDKVITVELSTGNYEDTIYYTLDGSSPLENGILYTVPINISEDAYLQTYTLRNGCISEISEYEYTVTPTYPFYFSNSLTNQDGEIITSDNIADVTKVKMTLSKLHTGDHSGIFLIAFYGADNRLIYVNYKTATISEDIDEVEIDITEDVSSSYKVKAFAWKDLSSIQPICDALEENIIIE